MAKTPVRIIDIDAGSLLGEFTTAKKADDALKTGFPGMKNGHRYMIVTVHKEYTASLSVVLEDTTATALKREAHAAAEEIEQSGLDEGDTSRPATEVPEKEEEPPTQEEAPADPETTKEEETQSPPWEEPQEQETPQDPEPPQDQDTVSNSQESEPAESAEDTSSEKASPSEETTIQNVEATSKDSSAEPEEDGLSAASEIDEAMGDLQEEPANDDELDKLEKELEF
jgi:outer membrane biosynthesis protein TonB